MGNKLLLRNLLLVTGLFLSACGTYVTTQIPGGNPSNDVYHISAHLQDATEVPPIATVQIFPTNTNNGAPAQTPFTTVLVYILVGAIILIALIAVLRK